MIASFRMYEVAPAATAAWRSLFAAAFQEADVRVDIVEHRWPEPIAALWARPDLACAFMCGWPFVRAATPMQPIAAPVPLPPAYEGLPRYRSEFLVRAGSGWTTLEQTFGHRFGFMARDSHSGFNAPRAHLANLRSPDRSSLYDDVVGPLGSPASALEALAAGEVDVVALDGFYLDLCRHHAPQCLEALRCVATTGWSPIPLLVAAPSVDRAVAERIGAVLRDAHARVALRPLLRDCLVERFVAPDRAAYAELEQQARRAEAMGYADIR